MTMARAKRKPGLSLQRHHEIGAQLKTIHDQLIALAVEVLRAYPVKSKAGRAADAFFTIGRGMVPIDRLRYALEDAMFTEHDGQPGCDLHAYCGIADHRLNDLADDEDQRVILLAGQIALVRMGRPYDAWDWQPCSQDDVDRARRLVQALDYLAPSRGQLPSP